MHRQLSTFIFLLPIVLFIAGNGQAAETSSEARLLRFPATNGRDLVFSHGGDLYRVDLQGGEAQRLTSHVGEEFFARFSPDGRQIAFTAQYDGNTEVYLLPSHGGIPRRLTYTSTNHRDDLGDRMGPNNIVMGWTPDGQYIIFRNRIGSSFRGHLCLVDTVGHLPKELPFPEGGFCSYSPDGKRLALNRVFREFRTWKRYTGGMADEVWVHDFAKGTTVPITHSKYQDIIPMWVGDSIYFVSERGGTANLYVIAASGQGEPRAVTHFTDFDVKFPSAHGHHIVFENGGYIYHYNAQQGQLSRVSVRLASEAPLARQEYKSAAKYLRGGTLSRGGDSIVFEARGDLFLLNHKLSVHRNITRTPGAYDRLPALSPADSRQLAYVSDRTGESAVHLLQLSTGQEQIARDPRMGYVQSLRWSPDGRTLAATDLKNNLWLIDAKQGGCRLLLHDSLDMPYGVNYSPDSRWLAYTLEGVEGVNQVWIMEIVSGRVYSVSGTRFSSSAPLFSADGKYLYFNSDRSFSPTYGSLDWNHVFNDLTGLYQVTLQRDELSPFAEFPNVAGESSEGKNKVKGGATVTPIRVDTEGLEDRVMRVPTPLGYHSLQYAKGSAIYYNRGENAYMYDLKSQRETQLCSNAALKIEATGSHALVYGRQGSLYVIPLPTTSVSLGTSIDLQGVRVLVDYPAEWRQIFDQLWRAYRDGFYVENMHGVDWEAMRAKYAQLLPYVTTRLDLNYLLSELISELNVGHAYVNPGEYAQVERVPLGLLGARLEAVEGGKAYRIASILPGNGWEPSLRSPLALPGLGVKVGDYLWSIDGVPVAEVSNPYSLLVGKAGRTVELEVSGPAKGAERKSIVIKPIENEQPLYHYAWLEHNRRLVDSLSHGRIGYVYIPDMGPEGLRSFARDFYPQLKCEGLIIDDRYNGGGNVSPMLIERLSREVYRVSMSRTSKRIGTTPYATHVGPKVCLINGYSASDGDLFPWSFQRLKLGKLIGTRTWGGIVGISGSLPFMDGTDVRVPFFTNYDPLSGEWIIENDGVHPDIEVVNDPVEEYHGRDRQLERAVEEVMRALPARRKLPMPPAPRVWAK